MTPFFHVDKGVLAGCPQAPLLAKAVLTPALAPWHEQHKRIHLSSWVDDIGFDTAGNSPQLVAQQAVEAYRDLHHRLTTLGLKVSPKKTAFIATDKHTNHALKEILTEEEPPAATVMRDLGVDHQVGRVRRISVMKQRLHKATQRRIRLRNLKIPALRVRLRLHRGGIQPVAIWGVESQVETPPPHLGTTSQRVPLHCMRDKDAEGLTTQVLEDRLAEQCTQLHTDQACPAPRTRSTPAGQEAHKGPDHQEHPAQPRDTSTRQGSAQL